jgi:polyisoprenoid-binding protein YceI
LTSSITINRRLRSLLPILAALLLIGVLAACQSAGDQSTEEPAAQEEAAAPTEEPTAEPEAETAEETDSETEEEIAAEAAPEAETEADAAASLQAFAFTSDGSEARFQINEVLFGNDKTVVGVTSDVSGEIRLDPQNPAASELGPITINARDLTTDGDRRNGAIRKFILQSDRDEYQYIVFTPTGIEGMPDAVSVGEPFTFQVTGDLQIRDVVHPETFDVSVTPNSESELSGLATTTVLRSDYGLKIPQVSNVTGVQEEVILEFEFTAAAQ